MARAIGDILEAVFDTTNKWLKVAVQAGTQVVGKVRLVTATGDEVTDDTADAIKAKLAANSGVDIGDVDVASMPANTVVTGTVTALDVTAAPHTVPTANSYVAITTPAGAGTVSLQITGVWVGQLEFEGTADLVNYSAVQASNGLATINAVAGLGPASMNSIFILPGASYRAIRVRASAWTSGTATITFVASIGTSASIQTGSLPAGANILGKVGIDQTTPGATNGVDLKTTAATALDATNKVPVSLYGKTTAAGDCPIPAHATYGMQVAQWGGASTLADGVTNSAVVPKSFGNSPLYNIAVPFLFNGATLDRQRGNIEATLLASLARTATVSSADQVNYNGRGLMVFINVTAIAATPSVVATIEAKDPISGVYTTLLASAAIVGTGHTVLRVYPGLLAVANSIANDLLPRTWRVTMTHGDADSITYSVGASVLL